MTEDQNLLDKFQAREEYEKITQTIFWKILSQEVKKKMTQLLHDCAGIDIGQPDGPCYASRVQGRYQGLEWLQRIIKDIKDGKISLQTPSV